MIPGGLASHLRSDNDIRKSERKNRMYEKIVCMKNRMTKKCSENTKIVREIHIVTGNCSNFSPAAR